MPHQFTSNNSSKTVANCLSLNNRIYRDSPSENEKKAYDLLHNETPFGSGAQKMTEEFQEMQGKIVGAFGYEAQATGVYHFTVYF